MKNITLKPEGTKEIIKNLSDKYGKKIALAFKENACSFDCLYKISYRLNKKLSNVISEKSRVAIIMPAGFNYTLLLLSLMPNYVVLPLNSDSSIDDFLDFFTRFKIDAIFVDKAINNDIIILAENNNISVIKFIEKVGCAIYFSVIYKRKKLSKINFSDKKKMFILPTSGTTSKPKIVLLLNSNVIHSVNNICKSLKLNSNDICLNPMPLSHVHGLMVTITSIFIGAKVVCTPKYNNDIFFECMKKFKPTWYTASAGIQENILKKSKMYKKIRENNLRFIRSSSAPLSSKTTKELELAFDAPVIESYGMTEATLQITSQPFPPNKRFLGSCGKAAGVDLKIVDENNKTVSVGKIGEIIIKGKNVIREYENNDEQNKKSFLNRWFKTGDLGYLNKEAFLFIVGRKKEIINKGGEKISPREIDEVLMSHPLVELGVAFSMPHKTLGEDLAVAIISKKNSLLLEKEIKKYMKTKLANFKIPSKFYFVDKIPKTIVGKPKRLGLYNILNKKKCKIQKIRNKTDLLVLKIWKKVLDIEIDMSDNYFEVGGDSISSQEIINEFLKVGIKIKYSDIQNYPTVKQLSDYIKNIKKFF
jgi:acyl-CoA synthetase (AMP-forming)/AMP-acid ligase II/acyl carrier protein